MEENKNMTDEILGRVNEYSTEVENKQNYFITNIDDIIWG